VSSGDASPPEEPPADADDWSSEQWIEWLKVTDAETVADGGRRPATTAGRIAHSTGGQLLGQSMIGLARAIYGQKKPEPVIVVQEANAGPGDDSDISLHLVEDHPEQSVAVVRKAQRPPLRPLSE
jgi:hypothetical protein